MKKWVYSSIITTLLVAGLSEPLEAKSIKVFLDGKPLYFEQEPIIEGGRTLVPLRSIFEALGAQVEWDSTTRTIKAVKKSSDGQREITLRNFEKNVNGRAMVPLRIISESFDSIVKWDAATYTINIYSDASKVVESDQPTNPSWSEIFAPNQIPFSYVYDTAWSPEGYFTVASDKGVWLYKNEKWISVGEGLSNLKITYIRWSSSGELAAIENGFATGNLDQRLWLYRDSKWSRIQYPELNEKYHFNDEYYNELEWSPDNVLTVAFGDSSFRGLWQYKDDQWKPLDTDSRITLSPTGLNWTKDGDIFLIPNSDHLMGKINGEWKIYPLPNGLYPRELAMNKSGMIVVGSNAGIWMLKNGDWTRPGGDRYPEKLLRRGVMDGGLSVSANNEIAWGDENEQGFLWLYKNGKWENIGKTAPIKNQYVRRVSWNNLGQLEVWTNKGIWLYDPKK